MKTATLIIILITLMTPATLSEPTFDELMVFLNRNRVNFNEYVRGEYTCLDFARDLQQEAHEVGMRSAVVVVRFPMRAHALNGFMTSDKGMVYWEPILDHRMKVELGYRYWWWLEMNAWYDDTIEKVCEYWNVMEREEQYCMWWE